MKPQILGIIQLVGAILAVILGFMNMTFYAIILLSVLFIVVGLHHLTEKEA